MRIKSQDDILNPEVRKQIIDEIEGSENKARKHEAFKRYQVYKDETDFFVIQMLLKQFSQDTVKEMSYAVSNISLTRKVIDKLARVYAAGVDRTLESDEDTEKLNDLEKKLEFDSVMKTVNRYLKLQRNISLFIKPCPVIDENGLEKYELKLNPLNPYLYDVVEDFYDRKKPMVYVLSNFDIDGTYYTNMDAGSAAVRFGSFSAPIIKASPHGDNTDQIIADEKEDEGKDEQDKKYVWWTDKYHFTTRGATIIDADTGEDIEITSPDDERISNPILEKPFANFAVDQDNSFWAKGGKDLTNGAITVNSLITNYHHIGVYTGFGQMLMTGKKLPKQVPIGPTTIIQLEYEEGDPVPTFDFKNANAPVGDLMKMVEMYVAMLLTTNNLSTSGVSTQLKESGGAMSGIALMIDKAESMEDVQDQRQIFIDKEPKIWSIINKWLMHYASDGSLSAEYDELVLPEDFDIKLEFREQQSIMSEAEKLANIEKRKNIGLNTMVELIKMDQPSLDDKQAEDKLVKIEDEKTARMDAMVQNGLAPDPNAVDNKGLPPKPGDPENVKPT